MKKTRKHLEHICKNCWYYSCVGLDTGILDMGICLNCDSPSDIRAKKPCDVCDGGGIGADEFGFRPCER